MDWPFKVDQSEFSTHHCGHRGKLVSATHLVHPSYFAWERGLAPKLHNCEIVRPYQLTSTN